MADIHMEAHKHPDAQVADTDGSRSSREHPHAHDRDVNASGHVQEMKRGFSPISLVGLALSVGNVWPAAGGAIVTALYNGGPPGEQVLRGIVDGRPV